MLPFIFVSSKTEKCKKKWRGEFLLVSNLDNGIAKTASSHSSEFDLAAYYSNFMVGIC